MRGRGRVGNNVGDQLLIALAVDPGGDDRVANAARSPKRSLDLAELHTVAVDFDLMVDPPEADDVAFRQIARKVAGPVKKLAGAEGIWDETFPGLCSGFPT